MKLSTVITQNPLFQFTAKSAIIFIFATYMLDAIIPSSKIENFIYTINQQFSTKIQDEKNQFYILGLIQNPVALYKSSEYYEKNGRRDRAIRDMELAIGLLEIHHVNNLTLDKYVKRLNDLIKIEKAEATK